ncbi:MAG: MFS transporter [Bacteroidales bacterium]|nr:MFS transporter [Bacteroidales bacterium]
MVEEKLLKAYNRRKLETVVAATLAYALYYVCRLSMGVLKQPLIDAGLLSATQLGVIGACMYWTYAVGKLVNGFLADGANIRRFMATGITISVGMNLIMGVLGITAIDGGIGNMALFLLFCLLWAANGWAQSMGAPASIVALSRWLPLKTRGTFYGFFSASHNIGEGLSFVFVGSIVAAFGWTWGFFGAALAGMVGLVVVLLFFHNSPESKGLPSIEILSGEMTAEEYERDKEKNMAAQADAKAAARAETKRMQKAVIKNPGVWILAAASAFMYMSRYAINEWGTIFLQEAKGYSLGEAASIIGINPIFGIIGTVVSGWLSDVLFKGDRRYPALVAGLLEAIALALFLYGGTSRWVNIAAMVLFGIAIGVLISFLGGLMAIDLVPRKASGAALGIVGIASYAAAGLQNIITGVLMDTSAEAGTHDFTYVSIFWLGSAVISFLLPLLNWKRKQQKIK